MKLKYTLIALFLFALSGCGTPPPADGPIYLGPPPTNDVPVETPTDAPAKKPKLPSKPADATGDETIQIQAEYEGRIVYGYDQEKAALYAADCQKRGGTFNECGSACAPDAEVCMDVCALTCDLN